MGIQENTYIVRRSFTTKERERVKKGLSYLKKANKLEPEPLTTLQMLERYYVLLGNYEKAKEMKKKLEALRKRMNE